MPAGDEVNRRHVRNQGDVAVLRGSAFQSLGVNHPKYMRLIALFGRGFAIVVPLLFAIIPFYVHFFMKTV